jgi:hypothetical protein
MRTTLLLAALVLAGCSSSTSGQPATADSGPAPSACATDPRAQTYSPGMSQPGATGLVKIALLSIAPNPPTKGNNSWTIKVTDASGAPLDGLSITVKPFMPDHGHPSSIVPEVAPAGTPGEYNVTLLNLFMPGIWTITFDVTMSNMSTDSSVFTFCI